MKKFYSALREVLNILSKAEKRSLTALFFMMLIGMLLEMAGIGIILPVFAIVTEPEKLLAYPGGQHVFERIREIDQQDLIISALLILMAFSLVKFTFLTALSYLQSKTTYDILSGVSSRLFHDYLKAPYAFHLYNNSSKLIRNAVTEVQVFAQNLINPALTLLTEALVTLGIISILLLLNPKGMGLSMVFIAITTFFFIRFTRHLSKSWGIARQHHEGERIKCIQEGLGCVKEIILLDRTSFYVQNYEHEASLSSSVAGKQVFLGQFPRQILELIAMVAICLVIWINLTDGEDLKNILPVLIMFAAAAFRMMPSMNRILGAINSLFYSYPSVKALTATAPDAEAEPCVGMNAKIDKFSVLELKNLEFSYSEATGKAIQNVSFSFKNGEMIGFVGETGSGKSTLLDLMLGLLKPTAGELLVNGNPMHSLLAEWRKKIGYVPQTITLIDDTIRRNIAFGLPEEQIDDCKVAQALRIAQLDAFIESLPAGVHTEVGERGVRLSGGQRQRIGIARALYHEPEIIFFDEATSALDNQTEAELMQSIEALHGNVTLVMIAHRLTTIMNCDRVYRLDKGRIVDCGAPGHVLRNGK